METRTKAKRASATRGVHRPLGAVLRTLRDEDLGALRHALADGADPNERDGDLIALARAAAVELNGAAFIEALLAAGADARQTDSNGSTALHAAALQGCPDAVPLLARVGADLNAEDSGGETPLLLACRHASGDGEDRHTQTALALIDAGADVNRAGAEGFAPVLVAAMRNSGLLIRRLAQAGADLTVRDARGLGIDYWALDGLAGRANAECQHPSPEALREVCRLAAWLLTNAPGREPAFVEGPLLCRAANCGWFEACAVLLDAGASPDARARCLDVIKLRQVERSARELASGNAASRAFALFDAESEAIELRKAIGSVPRPRRSLADLAGLPRLEVVPSACAHG
ncbi:ankyrin repeat domain-containing protein [Burkholderia pseudomallei]|uniref:ankyrin repeat domain-containing protein n=1 Tax=Burkholderia pseudomallei TaxID=28450 RepID=UPI000F097A4C|nr:ankyrin repeat domain-containing protein [Burkholderia pseudomallei]CAJ3079368.1 FOG domain-containing protein [Burkholderia pseudomallei]VCK80280.1 FOG domain-containing protein [Burkholderia pseudomallei]VCK83569.1 FOG domain-containing protein [Burkholderia pseudomallei]VCK91578.1 FOG domain-containing protein [Burkholderia pseudomallei]VCK96899.1 FOG domain-containing protein [Burkholderia pseudomallei]